MYAKGMTTGDIETHIKDIYGLAALEFFYGKWDKKYPKISQSR